MEDFREGARPPVAPGKLILDRLRNMTNWLQALDPALQPSAKARWQNDYDRALRQEKSGKVKMYAGLGVLTLGLTVGVRMSSSPDAGNGKVAAAVLLDAAGGVLTYWGVREYLDARSDLALLEFNRPAAGTAAAIRLSDHQSVQVGADRLSYAVSW